MSGGHSLLVGACEPIRRIGVLVPIRILNAVSPLAGLTRGSLCHGSIIVFTLAIELAVDARLARLALAVDARPIGSDRGHGREEQDEAPGHTRRSAGVVREAV